MLKPRQKLCLVALLMGFHTMAAAQPLGGKPNCGSQTLSELFRFSSAFDQYADAQLPNLEQLVNTRWKLVGLASGDPKAAGLGNAYDPTGLAWEGVVPEWVILDRAGLQAGGFHSVLFFSQARYYVHLRNWGYAQFQPADPAAVFQPDPTRTELGWDKHSSYKLNSVTFHVPVFGEDRDLFPFWGRNQMGLGQLYCRQDKAGLICFFEKSERVIALLRLARLAE